MNGADGYYSLAINWKRELEVHYFYFSSLTYLFSLVQVHSHWLWVARTCLVGLALLSHGLLVGAAVCVCVCFNVCSLFMALKFSSLCSTLVPQVTPAYLPLSLYSLPSKFFLPRPSVLSWIDGEGTSLLNGVSEHTQILQNLEWSVSSGFFSQENIEKRKRLSYSVFYQTLPRLEQGWTVCM